MIEIKVDPRKLTRKLQRLQDGLSRNQVASAINASVQSARGYASRLARTVVNLKAKQIYNSAARNTRGDRIHMYKTTAGELKGALYFTSVEPNIAQFGAKQSRQGAAVTTWRGLGRQYIHHAWQKKRQQTNWYKRTGKARTPYQGLRGPSMAEVMRPAAGNVLDFASKRMEIEYTRKIRGILNRG